MMPPGRRAARAAAGAVLLGVDQHLAGLAGRGIREAYGYREFGEIALELHEFLAARAWTANDGPQGLCNRAVAWLFEHKILLPGPTTIDKVVATVRAEAAERLWQTVAAAVSPELMGRLQGLLAVEEGSRLFQDWSGCAQRLPACPVRRWYGRWNGWQRFMLSVPMASMCRQCHRIGCRCWPGTGWRRKLGICVSSRSHVGPTASQACWSPPSSGCSARRRSPAVQHSSCIPSLPCSSTRLWAGFWPGHLVVDSRRSQAHRPDGASRLS